MEHDTLSATVKSTITTGVVLSIVLLVAAGVLSKYVEPYLLALETANLSKEEIIQAGVKGANERTTFPMQVDEVTTLTAIKGTKDALQYFFVLHDIDADMFDMEFLAENVISNVCGSNLVGLLEKGITIEYHYEILGTSQNYHIAINEEDCV